MRIIDVKYVPLPYAYKLLAESGALKQSAEGERPSQFEILQQTYTYLREFSKCLADNAMKAVERLKKEVGLSEYASVLIVNIRPRFLAELKAVLAAAKVGTTLTDEELKKVLNILDETCGPVKFEERVGVGTH